MWETPGGMPHGLSLYWNKVPGLLCLLFGYKFLVFMDWFPWHPQVSALAESENPHKNCLELPAAETHVRAELIPPRATLPISHPQLQEKRVTRAQRSCTFPAGDSRLAFSKVHIISLMLMIHLQTLQWIQHFSQTHKTWQNFPSVDESLAEHFHFPLTSLHWNTTPHHWSGTGRNNFLGRVSTPFSFSRIHQKIFRGTKSQDVIQKSLPASKAAIPPIRRSETSLELNMNVAVLDSLSLVTQGGDQEFLLNTQIFPQSVEIKVWAAECCKNECGQPLSPGVQDLPSCFLPEMFNILL